MEGEEAVREALTEFLGEHLPGSTIEDIDDILLNYIVGILEDIGSEDCFDVEDFVEMMEAYIPGFTEIDNDKVCKWMFRLADLPSHGKENTPPATREITEDPECLPLGMSATSTASQLRGTLDERLVDGNVEEEEEEDEEDDEKADQASGGQDDGCDDDQIRLLLEMFPSSCVVEAQKCLTIARGGMEHATQIMLDIQMDETQTAAHHERIEKQVRLLLEMFPASNKTEVLKFISQADGDMDKAARLMLLDQSESTLSAYNIKTRKPAHRDDKVLKASILDKYGYVDTCDDEKEHRPTAPKETKKKMVRYINNQTVTTRGERFVDVKKPETEEMKKTYINLKPGRKYRFH